MNLYDVFYLIIGLFLGYGAKLLFRREDLLQKKSEKLNAETSRRQEELIKLDRTAKLLVRRDLELNGINIELDKKVRELEKAKRMLEKSKTVLEIEVQARTRKLKELAEGLEDRVKKRTEELQEKMKESERFNRLAVDRELKMVELKKEIKKLKEGPEKKGRK